MWSVARFDLRLSDEDFFDMTPRCYDFLVQRHQADIERNELNAGIIASTIANWSMSSPQTPHNARMYMPSEWRTAHREKAREDANAVRRKQSALNIGLFLRTQAAKQRQT